MERAMYFGKEVEVIERGNKFSKIQNVDDPSSARTVSTEYLKSIRTTAGVSRAHKSRPLLTMNSNDANFIRLCDIFRQDPNFSMPISIREDQEHDVLDEISHAEDGITIASNRKLAPSHDITFSASSEVDALLKGSGGYAGPFYNSNTMRVFHGPRKAFYGMLLDAGFTPTRIGAAA